MSTQLQIFTRARKGAYVARVNQKYHLLMKTIWLWTDRFFRILLGVFSIAALIYTLTGSEPVHASQVADGTNAQQGDSWELRIAWITALLAVALNVLPVNEWSNLHLDLYRRWTALRNNWESLEIHSVPHDTAKAIAETRLLEELESLNAEKNKLDAEEPRQYVWLMRICQREVTHQYKGPDGESPQEMFQRDCSLYFPQPENKKAPEPESVPVHA